MRPIVLLNASFSEKKLILGADYFDCVSRAGGRPLVVPPVEGEIEDALRLAGGVLLVGGPDYVGSRKPMDERRKAFDLAFARAAVERCFPLLGICGGAQLLCLACDGCLVKHIPEDFEAPLWHAGDEHEVDVEPGTLLASVLGKGRHAVNSFHHQSVREPGKGMRVSARAPDGVVECIEPAAGEWFCLGVQWHPERMAGSPEADALFSALVKRASRPTHPGSSAAPGPAASSPS